MPPADPKGSVGNSLSAVPKMYPQGESLQALCNWVRGGLRLVLTRDADSESGLTALADLALVTSVWVRTGQQHCTAWALFTGIHSLSVEVSPPRESAPSPQTWARHLVAACVAPEDERARLEAETYRVCVDRSALIAQHLGPSWRESEISFIRHCLTGADLPPIEAALSAGDVYAFTHFVFFATNFGAVRPNGDANDFEGRCRTLLDLLRNLVGSVPDQVHIDAALEIALAQRFLTGQWPLSLPFWMHAAGVWARGVLASTNDGGHLMSTYHPLLLSAYTFDVWMSDHDVTTLPGGPTNL